jgi:hypothetical protein
MNEGVPKQKEYNPVEDGLNDLKKNIALLVSYPNTLDQVKEQAKMYFERNPNPELQAEIESMIMTKERLNS